GSSCLKVTVCAAVSRSPTPALRPSSLSGEVTAASYAQMSQHSYLYKTWGTGRKGGNRGRIVPSAGAKGCRHIVAETLDVLPRTAATYSHFAAPQLQDTSKVIIAPIADDLWPRDFYLVIARFPRAPQPPLQHHDAIRFDREADPWGKQRPDRSAYE